MWSDLHLARPAVFQLTVLEENAAVQARRNAGKRPKTYVSTLRARRLPIGFLDDDGVVMQVDRETLWVGLDELDLVYSG